MAGIEFRTELPAIEDYWPLYQTTGWNDEYSLLPEDAADAIGRSWHAVAAYDGERLAGFGRVVSDGVMHAMIYDLIVHPDYQRRGIGGSILAMLVQKCLDEGVRDIQLFSARGRRGFYEKRGFAARPDDAPGMQYTGGDSDRESQLQRTEFRAML